MSLPEVGTHTKVGGGKGTSLGRGFGHGSGVYEGLPVDWTTQVPSTGPKGWRMEGTGRVGSVPSVPSGQLVEGFGSSGVRGIEGLGVVDSPTPLRLFSTSPRDPRKTVLGPRTRTPEGSREKGGRENQKQTGLEGDRETDKESKEGRE